MEGKKYFVYGTLMQYEILAALGLKLINATPAVMPEATLYKANSGRFPFLVLTHDPRDSVKGLIVELDLIDPQNRYSIDEILDQYEGAYGENPLYHRKEENRLVFYIANRGNPYVVMQLSAENMIGGDWNEFREQA